MAATIKSLPVENWKPVVGFSGLYEVSDMGGVRSVPFAHSARAWMEGKTLKPCVGCHGYLYVTLYREVNARGKRRPIHQLVLEAFVGPRPCGHEPDHRNRVRGDNCLTNLRWVTKAENNANRVVRRGDNSGTAKLRQPQVLEIRSLRRHGRPLAEIAAKYGVCEATISMIANRKIWAHVG